LKNLSKIIHARVEMWSRFYRNQSMDMKILKKLIAGIVLTGGGAQLKHIKQLVDHGNGYKNRISKRAFSRRF
jgi:cell division protein FtsA